MRAMRTYYAFVVWCAVCYFAGIGAVSEAIRAYDRTERAPGVTTVEHYR